VSFIYLELSSLVVKETDVFAEKNRLFAPALQWGLLYVNRILVASKNLEKS